MNARDSLLVALPAALVGAAIGFFLSQALGVGEQAVKASVPSPASANIAQERGQPRGNSALSLGSSQGEGRAPMAASPREKVDVSKREFDRAADRVVTPEAEQALGAGDIRGRVFDEMGEPLSGVILIASTHMISPLQDPSQSGNSAPAEESLDTVLQNSADQWAELRAGRSRATSETSGNFTIQGLDATIRYSIRAYAEGYALEPDNGSYVVLPGSEVTFRAKKVHQLSIQVVHGDGTPVTQASAIEVKRGRNRPSLYAWSPEQPFVRLAAGRVSLRALSGLSASTGGRDIQESTFASDAESLVIGDITTQKITLELHGRAGITGRVVDGVGGSSSRLQVYLLATAEDGEFDEDELSSSNRRANRNSDSYSFLDLAPGTYAIGVTGGNNSFLVTEVVEVGAELVELDLVIAAPNPLNYLAITAEGPGGRRLTKLSFRLLSRTPSGTNSSGVIARLDEQGTFWMQPGENYFQPWKQDAYFKLTATHSELGQKEINLSEGQREVHFVLEEPISLLVAVDGYGGSPWIGQLQMRATNIKADGENGTSITSGRRGRGESLSAAGEYRFDGLAPGRWRVELLVMTDRWNGTSIDSTEVDLEAGEKLVTFPLPTLYSQTIVAPGLEEGSRLYLRLMRSAGNSGQPGRVRNLRERTDEDGRATFKMLRAGTYRLTGNGQFPETEITVPGGDYFLETQGPNAIRVSIGDLKGLLATSGLQAGDLIVGTDGSEFKVVKNPWQLLSGEGRVSLMVLRAGQRIEVSFPKFSTENSNWYKKLGGMLEAVSNE